ncbi:hypothetical protein [Actinomadura macrotermitis]|uniref:Uncharacterized protein n=1 Tax=Actinomadura macrotermitis TaxID=2585200 RepID=A0A7K0C7S6_9ACTN|nr:hypothetical protein [Actinomadura macrotermitis]MQY09468.1 hypothetical protein [Actinomadura macrotermitis]
MNASELALVLFTTSLQPSGHPCDAQVRAAIEARLRALGGDRAGVAASVAQEAGDHPEAYAARMHWALDAVGHAYRPGLLAAA